MKKAIILLTLILVLSFIAACGNEPESSTQEVPATTEVQETPVPEIEGILYEELDCLAILQEYLGVSFTVNPVEFTWTDYSWQFLELHDELDLDNFPGEFGGSLISVLISATEEGDVFIVTCPDGVQYLQINRGAPFFYVVQLEYDVELGVVESLSWSTWRTVDIRSLTLEMIPEMRDELEEQRARELELSELGRELDRQMQLLIPDVQNISTLEWNRRVFDLVPTSEVFLEFALQPSDLIESDHPEIIELADYIAYGLDNDMDKARAIHTWVARNIYFDMDGNDRWEQDPTVRFWGPDQDSALRTLRERHGWCGSYTNLTVALLRAVNIPSMSMVFNQLEDGILNDFHGGYMAFVDGRWLLGDSSYGRSGNLTNGEFVSWGNANVDRTFDMSIDYWAYSDWTQDTRFVIIIHNSSPGWGLS